MTDCVSSPRFFACKSDVTSRGRVGISRRPSVVPGLSAGFTLLELIIALALVAVMSVVAAPMIGKGIGTMDQRSAAQKIAAQFKAARNEAVAQRTETVVVINHKALTVTGHGKDAVSLSSGIALDFTTIEKEKIDDDSAGIRFYPDGGSTGGRVTLKKGARSLRVDVDWLTGRVKVSEDMTT